MCSANTNKSANRPQAWWRGWWADEHGVAAIEYGLLAALIVVGAMTGFTALGGSVSDLFTYWSEKVIEALDQVP